LGEALGAHASLSGITWKLNGGLQSRTGFSLSAFKFELAGKIRKEEIQNPSYEIQKKTG
jgi:hypothetical protein